MVIYKFTNKVNDKSYIGYTKYDIEHRWEQHCRLAGKDADNRAFYNALRKYGTDCWNKEVLTITSDVSEAKKLEGEYITEFDSYNNGYNNTLGGDGFSGKHREESKRKTSQALKGVPKNYDRKAMGLTLSEETKQKISKAHTGMKKPWVKWSKEQIETRALTRRSLTREQYDEIHALRSQGKLIREIASVTGHSDAIVKKWLKRDWDL